MNDSQAIGVRLDMETLSQIDDFSKAIQVDRSNAIRMLLREGYQSYLKRKAAELYKSGKITMSSAAADAKLTIWEMEQYLVRHGYKSTYSVDDLKSELKAIEKMKKK